MSPLKWMGILCIILIALYLYFSHTVGSNTIPKVSLSHPEGVYEHLRLGGTHQVSPFDDYSVDGVGEPEPPKSKDAVIQASQGVEQDSGICNKPSSAKDVCRNYGPCCEVSNTSQNCLCDNPLVKDCRTIYKECLADKYFSQETMDFIDPGNKGKVCKRILDSCCNYLDAESTDSVMTKVTMHTPTYDAKKICQVQGGTVKSCKRICETNPKCVGAIYSKGASNCALYDVPLVTKAGAYQNETDTETDQFMKKAPVKEGFEPAFDYCLNNKSGGYWGVNNVVKECQTKRDACMRKSSAKEGCQSMYAACCSILDGLDMTERFRFMSPEPGVANADKKLYQGTDIPTLDACKNQCLVTPGCDYIYSNIGAPNVALGFCGLYKGTPAQGQAITFGKANPGAKQIWRKEPIPDEETATTTTAPA